MKMLFTLSYFTPYISGLTIHVSRAVEGLAAKGHSITVLTSQHDKHLPILEKNKTAEIVRVPYLVRLHKGFIMPLYVYYAYTQIKKHDVVVVNVPQPESFITAFFAKLLKKRLYVIYHCDVHLPPSLSNRIIEFVMMWLHSYSLTQADTIITYTEDYAKHSMLLKRFLSKIATVYPPVPIPQINLHKKKEISKTLPIKKGYFIGIAARIAAEKGIEYVVEAFPYIEKSVGKPVQLLIAGPRPVGEDAYFAKIQSLTRGATDKILFTGGIPPEDMGSFYSLLDVLVLPSVNSTEAFGLVQVEAMMCGVPVVASDLPGVRIPIAVTGMGQIAEPGNSRDIAKKIANVIQLGKEYGNKSKTVHKIFSYKSTVATYERIFTGIS